MPNAGLFHRGDPFPEKLTGEQRKVGQKRFRAFLLLNGISVALLMENMLILYAIGNGASDPVVAVIASFIHLTMPAMVIGKRWVSRFGLARTMGLGWFFRYVSAMAMLLAPLFARLGYPAIGIGTIVVGSFGFAFFRSIGAVVNTPLTGEITNADERGSFIGGNTARVQSTHIATMVAVILVLRQRDTLPVYQVIIAVGAAVGFFASRVLVGIPESAAPSLSAKAPLGQAVKELFATPRLRKLFFGWCAGFVSFAAVIPFAMITVKNGYGLSDSEALSYSLILVIGAIASALLGGLIADRVGPRPLIVIYIAGLLGVAVFWAFAPVTYVPVVVGASFFFAGFFKTGIMTGLGHYFLSTAGEDQRVGVSLVMRVGGGTAAGLFGSVIGASLLDLLAGLGLEGMGLYHSYFRVMLIPLGLLLFVVTRLERLAEWRISNVLSLILSPRDLRALFVLNRLKRSADRERAVRDLRTLERIGSQMTEGDIRRQLSSPRLDVRVRAIRALRSINFGRKTTDALIREIDRGEFTTAWVAAEVLGGARRLAAVPALVRGLRSADHLLQGTCISVLVEMGVESTYDEIVRVFGETSNPRVAIHGAGALARIGGPKNLTRILHRSVDPGLPAGVRDELLTTAASMVGAETHLYRFLRSYNDDKERGVGEVLPELPSTFGRHAASRIEQESRDRSATLRHFPIALAEVAERSDDEHGAAIARFLGEFRPSRFPRRLAFSLAIMLSALVQRDPAGAEDHAPPV